MTAPKTLARTAGLLYLLLVVGGLFTAGADTLTMLYVDMYNNGVSIDFVFDSLWLLPLGYLVIRSGYFPKVLGVRVPAGKLPVPA